MHSWFRHRPLSSLRIRLMLLVLLAVIPALGLILHTAATQRRSATVEVQEDLLRLTRFAAANQRQAIEGARQLLIALSQMPQIRERNVAECNQLLANLLRQYKAYAGFGVVDAAGNSICSAPATTTSVYAGDRAYFRLARETRDFAIGEYQIGRVTGKATLNFGYPILDESGEVGAVVLAALDLTWLDRLAAEVELPEGSIISVTDRKGTILVRYPDSQNWVGKSVPNALITRRTLSQREGITDATSLDGVERTYAFTTLGSGIVDQDVHIRIGIPQAVAFAESNQLLVQNLIGLGCVTALALTAAWIGGDVFLTRKVTSLVQTTQKLQKGDLSARTELAYESGELGQLAHAFDEMAAAIEAREQAIAALNQDLKTLFEVIPIGVLIAQDPEFKQIRSNPAFAQILGLSPDTNVSYTPGDAPLPSYKLLREGRELTPSEFPLRDAALRKTEIKGTQVDILREDGSIFNLFGYAKPLLDERGNVRGSVAAFLDISDRVRVEEERKQAEAEREQLLHQLEASLGQLEAVINNMTEGLVMTNPQGDIVRFNPVALALHEYDSIEQVQRHIHEFPAMFEVHDLQGNFVPFEQWPISKALNGQTFSNYEVQVHRRDTGKTWIGNYGGTPIWSKQGQVILAIVTIRDVSEQRQAQVELARSLAAEKTARADAEAANRIKDEFLAVLSHELRTPLTPILGWSKLLRSRQYDPATTDRALETIERNAKLQTQLIEDLLDVSRILQGKLRLESHSVDLNAIIQAAIETVHLAANTKSVQIHTFLDQSVGTVSGDAGRLQQVIWNLLSNAVKFTSPGGRVEVRLERGIGDVREARGAREEGADPFMASLSSLPFAYAQIRVTDTGQGIDPEFLPYVFDTFRQADGATTRQFGGLGLGLAIARHIVELHGGVIAAASPGEGQGATFVVRLPLSRHPEEHTQDHTEIQPVAASPSRPLSGLRILIVDDEVDTRSFLTFVLEQAGADVMAVASAKAALLTLSQSKPDLLLSDIGMADIDGYTLMQQIRTLPPQQGGKIPAIALTAYAGELDQRQAIAAGFQFHLVKPVEPDQLIKTVTSLSASHMPSTQETG
jgi:signal transduction histidine kinase/ActR/RegA family two-component response regulator/HAMP domain-containing protein